MTTNAVCQPCLTDNRKNVVVIGGGTAGANVCKPLSAELDPSKYNIILINPLPFRIWLPSILRYLVAGADIANTIFLPYDKLFLSPCGTFVQGKVCRIEPGKGDMAGEVLLESGLRISYHILVLATGSTWEGPPHIPMVEDHVAPHVQATQNRFAKANHILIVGGGAIGCEIAGEVKDKWPDKQVTIAQAFPLLLNSTYSDKFRTNIERDLKQRGVDIILNDFVDFEGEGEVPTIAINTRSNQTIHNVDLVVRARGPRPNTAFIAASLGKDAVTNLGLVKIRPTLQLRDYDNIFACGDIIDWAEQKQAIKAGAHGRLVAQNISSLLQDTPMKKYRGSTEIILLTGTKL